jgi:hypothetical protein
MTISLEELRRLWRRLWRGAVAISVDVSGSLQLTAEAEVLGSDRRRGCHHLGRSDPANRVERSPRGDPVRGAIAASCHPPMLAHQGRPQNCASNQLVAARALIAGGRPSPTTPAAR